jgi:(E)-4-hydroxy-3-methylbut-2-enyl-diphosphate synthase
MDNRQVPLSQIARKKTKHIHVGKITIGGDAPISVQSMTKCDTKEVESALEQINRLHVAGCDIARLAIPDDKAAKAFEKIKQKSPLPLVADIHFDHKLALASIESGADCIRINPGNIEIKTLKLVINSARKAGIPIRIGINTGSVKSSLLKKHGSDKVSAMAENLLEALKPFDEEDFHDIKISAKSSDVLETISIYRKISLITDYPLHLGVTAAGSYDNGIVKSAIGIGTLLAEGIGDTIRVSLTGDPVKEVFIGKKILKSLNLLHDNVPIVISCPTCGRCKVNLIDIVHEVEDKLQKRRGNIKVAVMGCEVNGPKEAADADLGMTFSGDKAIIFKQGKISKKVSRGEAIESLLEVFESLRKEESQR